MCDLDMLNENDILDDIIGGIMIAFWPVTVCCHFFV